MGSISCYSSWDQASICLRDVPKVAVHLLTQAIEHINVGIIDAPILYTVDLTELYQ